MYLAVPSKTPPSRITVLVYGESRTGKTRLTGTFPRVFAISDGVEGGFETYGYMPNEEFYEPDHPPVVASPQGEKKPGCFSIADVNASLAYLEDEVKNHPGRFQTVVIDSLTFLSDLYEDHFSRVFREEIEKNRWFLYQKLKTTLRSLMITVHKLPLNVVWTALASSDEGSTAGPLIGGQTQKKLPAACNLLLYMNMFQRGSDDPVRELRTKKYGKYAVGHRYGDLLPDPVEPSYRALMDSIMESKAARANGNGSAQPAVIPAAMRQVRQPVRRVVRR